MIIGDRRNMKEIKNIDNCENAASLLAKCGFKVSTSSKKLKEILDEIIRDPSSKEDLLKDIKIKDSDNNVMTLPMWIRTYSEHFNTIVRKLDTTQKFTTFFDCMQGDVNYEFFINSIITGKDRAISKATKENREKSDKRSDYYNRATYRDYKLNFKRSGIGGKAHNESDVELLNKFFRLEKNGNNSNLMLVGDDRCWEIEKVSNYDEWDAMLIRDCSKLENYLSNVINALSEDIQNIDSVTLANVTDGMRVFPIEDMFTKGVGEDNHKYPMCIIPMIERFAEKIENQGEKTVTIGFDFFLKDKIEESPQAFAYTKLFLKYSIQNFKEYLLPVEPLKIWSSDENERGRFNFNKPDISEFKQEFSSEQELMGYCASVLPDNWSKFFEEKFNGLPSDMFTLIWFIGSLYDTSVHNPQCLMIANPGGKGKDTLFDTVTHPFSKMFGFSSPYKNDDLDDSFNGRSSWLKSRLVYCKEYDGKSLFYTKEKEERTMGKELTGSENGTLKQLRENSTIGDFRSLRFMFLSNKPILMQSPAIWRRTLSCHLSNWDGSPWSTEYINSLKNNSYELHKICWLYYTKTRLMDDAKQYIALEGDDFYDYIESGDLKYDSWIKYCEVKYKKRMNGDEYYSTSNSSLFEDGDYYEEFFETYFKEDPNGFIKSCDISYLMANSTLVECPNDKNVFKKEQDCKWNGKRETMMVCSCAGYKKFITWCTQKYDIDKKTKRVNDFDGKSRPVKGLCGCSFKDDVDTMLGVDWGKNNNNFTD